MHLNIADIEDDRIQRKNMQNFVTIFSDPVVSPLFATMYQYKGNWNTRTLAKFSDYKK
jgi:hypothetical protein